MKQQSWWPSTDDDTNPYELMDEQKPRKCTKNNPYTVERNNPLSRWIHVDANEVHDSQESHQYGGDTIRLKCPHCGIEWTEELPQ